MENGPRQFRIDQFERFKTVEEAEHFEEALTICTFCSPDNPRFPGAFSLIISHIIIGDGGLVTADDAMNLGYQIANYLASWQYLCEVTGLTESAIGLSIGEDIEGNRLIDKKVLDSDQVDVVDRWRRLIYDPDNPLMSMDASEWADVRRFLIQSVLRDDDDIPESIYPS